MSFTPIPPGPDVPDSSDPETTFDAQFEAFLTWLKDELGPGANEAVAEIAAYVVTVLAAAGAVASAKNAAELAAAAAALSAASAINSAGTSATSTTSLALTAGAKSWTIQTGKLFPPGQPIYLASAADPTKRMSGLLLTHNPSTGACTSNMTPDPGATGTYADWIMGVGVSAASSVSLPRSARTSNTALNVGDKGKLIDITSGSFAQTNDAAGTLGADWFVWLTNSGTGVPTWSTLSLPQGSMFLLHSDGTTVRSYPLEIPIGVLMARDEKATGTNGGNSTSATWITRDLNTVVLNTIAGASLASNQVTLPPGTYQLRASAPMFGGGGSAQSHQLRLYNVTASTVAAVGTSERASSSGQTRSLIVTQLVVAVTSAFRLEHWVATGTGVNGLGNASGSGAIEVYSDIECRKVA
jgi:hypothetical protein